MEPISLAEALIILSAFRDEQSGEDLSGKRSLALAANKAEQPFGAWR